MSAGRLFHARGPATENILSVTRSLVRRTAKLLRAAERSRVSSQRSHSSARYCAAVQHDQGAELELDTGSHGGGAAVREVTRATEQMYH